jgi:hypothetical protein
MPIKCRVSVCGFDPILVRGYVKTGFRALWWHLPDEVYEEYKVKPGDIIVGILDAVYNAKAEKVAEPKEPFEWATARESGLTVVLPPDVITKYRLTAWHFLELTITAIKRFKEESQTYNTIEVYPGKEVRSKKWWPEDKMKLHYYLEYIPP